MYRRLTASADATSAIFQPRQPYPHWDGNWDHRSLDSRGVPREAASGRRRHVILVCHCADGTALSGGGRARAVATGERLREMTSSVATARCRCVHASPTAVETADLIAAALGAPRMVDPQLAEGVPSQAIPGPPQHSAVVFRDGARLEAAFRRYLKRSLPRDETDLDADDDQFAIDDDECSDELDVLVCQPNAIRYLFLRALQLPPEAWLRLDTKPGSITHIVIAHDGLVTAHSLSDTGHLDGASLLPSAD